MSDHTAFEPPVGELRDEFRIFAMDRRGFGASLESPSYSAEREFSDVAAVVDAVAGQTGRSVVLFGHSWGGSCALGASPHLPSLRAVVLYEPSLGLQYPPGAIDRIEERVAAGDNEGAVIEMLTGVAGLTEDEIAERRAAPNWPERVATAPRSPGRPASRAKHIGAPSRIRIYDTRFRNAVGSSFQDRQWQTQIRHSA
jgi:pimeloyl-ACP methyl ester carboxylesterase